MRTVNFQLGKVIDENNNQLIDCAIMRVNDNCVRVKPLTDEYYSEDDWFWNKSLHSAWWQLNVKDVIFTENRRSFCVSTHEFNQLEGIANKPNINPNR